MAGPIIRTYKSGSIVYFEKDPPGDIYVLQNGRVVLSYLSVDGKVEMKEDVRLGEFFGVKSALGKYPREETAQVLGGATLLVFKLSEFEAFVANKTHLILKMMKVFSSQLRQIHGKVREQLGQFGEQKSPAFELMNVAEVFHKNGSYDHAIYAYSTYLKYYPQGVYSGRAQELMKLAQKGAMFPMNMPELVYEYEKRDTSGGFSGANTQTAAAAAAAPQLTGISADFQTAEKAFKTGDFANALEKFRNILSLPSTGPADDVIVEKSTFLMGMSQAKIKDFDTAYNTLTGYVKRYPKGEKVKESIFNLGIISENKGETDKAIALFKKVSALPPADDFTRSATDAIARLGG